jgi:hypothetical protein
MKEMLMPRFASVLATLALTVAVSATAFAQATDAVRIRGTITSFDAGVLTIQGAASAYKVMLPDNVRLQWITKSDLSKIGPNTYVGTVASAQPDGSLRATEVQIFPEALRGVGEGSRPWDTLPNSSMTNATVTTIAPEKIGNVDGLTMTVSYKGTDRKVFVPENVPVITYLPADKAALTAGSHVIVNATKGADGMLTTTTVQVGKDGLTPPM